MSISCISLIPIQRISPSMFLVSHFRVRRILFTRHEKNLIKSLNPFDRSEKGLTRSRKNLPHDFLSEFGRDECAPLVAASRALISSVYNREKRLDKCENAENMDGNEIFIPRCGTFLSLSLNVLRGRRGRGDGNLAARWRKEGVLNANFNNVFAGQPSPPGWISLTSILPRPVQF